MKRPRPFVYRMFFEWLESQHAAFIVPFHMTSETDRSIEFEFDWIISQVRGLFRRDWGIVVSVEYEGTCWDLLCDFGLLEGHSGSGYCNMLVLPEVRQIYPDRRSLWVNEVFQPFLEWVNTELAKAAWLGFYGEAGKWTAVRLLEDRSRGTKCLALRRGEAGWIWDGLKHTGGPTIP